MILRIFLKSIIPTYSQYPHQAFVQKYTLIIFFVLEPF